MNKKTVKKKSVKRKYQKINTKAELVIHQTPEPVIVPRKPENDIEQLAGVCKMIDSWDDEARERNLRFIYSKYQCWFD